MFGHHCTSHQAVLAMRPSIEAIPGLPGNATRLGHLFQTSTFTNKWFNAARAEAGTPLFRYVDEMPAGSDEWLEHNRLVMKLARPAKDMSLEDENFVLMLYNCLWQIPIDDETPLIHYHTPSCPCGGRAEFARNCSKAHLLLLSCLGLCLLNRWVTVFKRVQRHWPRWEAKTPPRTHLHRIRTLKQSPIFPNF